MKKFLITLLIFISFIQSSECFEIVYPKSKNAIINSNSTFFIGHSDTPITINGEDVPTVENGGFAYVVKLSQGKNIFEIKSSENSLTYTITRPTPSKKATQNILSEIPFTEFVVNKDNTAFRSTAKDYGINRLSLLPKGTRLIVNGEQGNFYRIYLNKTSNAWIAKSDISPVIDEQTSLASIKCLKTKHSKDFDYYRFKLSKKIPFSVINDEKLILSFYNLENTDVYTFIPDKEKIIGYDYYYDDENIFTLKVRRKNCKIKPIILIDAGHGGKEKGAIGCCGHYEKDINLSIANLLKDELEEDFPIVMTREDDSQVSLQKRVETIKNSNATISVSIHANALPDNADPNKNRGTSVYYYQNQAKPLAESILKEITEQVKTNNDRVRRGSLALVRPTQAVCVLVEVAYMINPHDNMLLLDENFRKDCAKAIADGIRKFLQD